MLLSLMLIGCGNTQPVQDTEDIALTEAPMEEEQVSPEEKTFDSLVKLDEGIYMMDCYTDYLVDEYLAENITETEQLDVWFTENLTQGVPTGDIPDTGCSSFAICDGDGNHLFGRNYDMVSGEALILRTMPEKGYKSIGIVDLMHLNIGSHCDYELDDEAAKPLLLAAPWCICDGINEKGLGVSLLELNDKHMVEDTEKDNLLIYTALRVILDRCATIDEAVELLNSYDMYSPRPNTYHIFITDLSGRSVVAEWDNNEMYVVEDKAATNYMLYKERTTFTGDNRYRKIHETIDTVDSMSADEAMELLDSVHQMTRWSAVYNLEKLSVDVCFNENYDKKWTEGL